MAFLSDLRAQLAALEHTRAVIEERGDHLLVHVIQIDRRHQRHGLGTKAMRHIHAYADRTRQAIRLTPSSGFGVSEQTLIGWYTRLGYTAEIVDGQIRMVRQPATASATVEETR